MAPDADDLNRLERTTEPVQARDIIGMADRNDDGAIHLYLDLLKGCLTRELFLDE